MKAVFIAFIQAHYEPVVHILDRFSLHGFTYWEEVRGRGSSTGEPHYGSHAWPSLNGAIFTVVPDEKVDAFLQALHALDEEAPAQGLRAFVMNVEKSI